MTVLRRWMVAALLGAAVLAGCAEVADQTDQGAVVFHAVEVLPEGQYHCAGCHYGVAPVWRSSWDDAGGGEWDLVIGPAWPDVELLSIDARADGEEPLAVDSGFLYESMDGEWRFEFEVPVGASSLFVRFYTEHETTPVGPVGVVIAPPGQDPEGVPTTLVLTTPGGQEIPVEGPEVELKHITLLGPAPGTWTFTGTAPTDQGDLRGRAFYHAGGAGAVSAAETAFGEPARLRFPAGTDGAPPNVTIAVRPYHDHAPFVYGTLDWDYADSFVYTSVLEVRNGTAPPPFQWTEEAADPFWGGAERVTVQAGRPVSLTEAYVEEEGHRRDGGWPRYYTQADPIPPGTATVRFEVTWDPPVEEPRLGIRFGPASTPYYQEAEPVERGLGSAVFEATWRPEWWDVVFDVDGPALAPRGSLDIAPYIAADDGEVVARSWEGTLDAYAVRGPIP